MTYDWISFDCYGTLIDWEAGLKQFFSRLAAKRQVPIPPMELLKTWEPIQFKLIQGPYRRYREILQLSLEETLRHHKIGYDREDGRRLAAAFATWQPFGDVPRILPALRTIARLAIISNTDRDYIARAISTLGVTPSLVVVAEDVRAYKPSPKPFEEALRRMGVPAERCLHVAFGVTYDLGPARALGFKTCLLRRGRVSQMVQPAPDLDVPNLDALIDRLEY